MVEDGTNSGRSSSCKSAEEPLLTGQPESFKRRFTPLPDLTAKLQEYGMLEEYQRQRHGYMKWRQWWNDREIAVTGARGEITSAQAVLDMEKGMAEFKGWYKDFASWRWHKTYTYWVAVTFLIGGLLFAIASFAMCYPYLMEPPFEQINAYVAFGGNIYFTVGMYLMLVSVANFNRQEVRHNALDYWAVRKYLCSVSVHANSYHICLVYFVGVAFYNPYTFVAMIPFEKPAWLMFWFSSVPSVVGGLLFWVGGMLEMLENEVWPFTCFPKEESDGGKAPLSAMAASVCNTIGGFFFFAPAFNDFFGVYPALNIDHNGGMWWGGMMWGIGSLLYSLGAVFSVVMWQNHQFGLQYMANLNFDTEADFGDSMGETSSGDGPSPPCSSPRGKSPPCKRKRKKKLSVRSVLMVVSCAIFSSLALTNSLMEIEYTRLTGASMLHWTEHTFPFVFFFLFLLASSAVPHLPPDQPYRFIMLALRFLCFILGVVVTYHTYKSFYVLLRLAA